MRGRDVQEDMVKIISDKDGKHLLTSSYHLRQNSSGKSEPTYTFSDVSNIS